MHIYLIIAFLTFLSLTLFIKKGFCYTSIVFFFIFITHFLGYLFIDMQRAFFKVAVIEDSLIDITITHSLIAITSYYVIAVLPSLYTSDRSIFNINFQLKSPQLFCFSAFLLSSIAIIYYLLLNGANLDPGNYANRLEDNAGNGLVIILMTAFIPALIIPSLYYNNRYILINQLSLALFFGLLYFFIIGGSRNILLGAIFLILIILYQRKLISTNTLISLLIIVTTFAGLLLYYRSNQYANLYKNDYSSFLIIILSYISDSLSPLDYQSVALDYFIHRKDILGIDYFFNQFSSIIPRIIWPDKPIVTMNSSYFFSKEILELQGNLNMASTLLSSSLLIMGKNFYWLLYAAVAFIMRFFDKMLLTSRSFIVYITLLMSLPFSFFIARECFELFLFIVLKNFITVIICYCLYKFLYYIFTDFIVVSYE